MELSLHLRGENSTKQQIVKTDQVRFDWRDTEPKQSNIRQPKCSWSTIYFLLLPKLPLPQSHPPPTQRAQTQATVYAVQLQVVCCICQLSTKKLNLAIQHVFTVGFIYKHAKVLQIFHKYALDQHGHQANIVKVYFGGVCTGVRLRKRHESDTLQGGP